MTLGIQKNILGLEVPVYDVLLVQSLNGTYDLSCVEFCPRLMELLLLSEVGEELTTVQEVNEEVQLAIGLEGKVQSHDVWVLDFFQYVSLS